MERHQESQRSRKIPTEILQEILLRLPTKDVVRSSCVSKLWRRIVKDPSFGKLHAAGHASAPSESEVLLVSENREPDRNDEASVFNLSSGTAMCHVAIPSGYSLTNICNGFLCFTLYHYYQGPVIVCNPVTGETLELPTAPPISVSVEDDGDVTRMSHRFILGFSPPTKEYKIFRLSFPPHYPRGHKTNYITVYTLGSRRGWRQYSYVSQFCPFHSLPPPVHIDGNLYIPVETGRASHGERAAQMLILNVATETHCSYHIPYYYNDAYHPVWNEMLANGFELNGQMCLAVNVIYPSRKLQFWVMAPPGELDDKDEDKLYWDLRYCFDMDGERFYFPCPRGAWLDHNEMLCYRHGNCLYKHAIGGTSLSSNDDGRLLLFDQRLDLPEAPSASSWSSHSASLPPCGWNICGGLPTQLSLPNHLCVATVPRGKGEETTVRAKLATCC